MAKKPAKPVPDLTEQTEAQQPLSFPWMGNGLLWGNGGSCENPCAFPRYGDLYGRSYWTYRWMLQHAVIRHARANAVSVVLASTWDYAKSEKGIPEERVDLVRKNFDPLRNNLLADFYVRGRDWGCAVGEPIWDLAGGEYRLTEVKPLLLERTQIVVDKYGRFTGLTQGTTSYSVTTADGEAPGLPAPYKAWVYTYDRECGNLYGRSWLENIRETAWKDWLDCAQQLQKLGAKISGTQTIIRSPESKKEISMAGIKALNNGASGLWMPNIVSEDIKPGQNVELWKLVAQLAKSSLTDIQVIDFGSTTPAITGLLERMKHDEELMFEGGLLSSRTGQEGQHGTKAEAQTHKDTGVTIAELDDNDFADQVQPLVDALLVLKYGEDAAGTVRIDPPPLVDNKADRAKDTLTIITADTPMAKAVARVVDVPRLLKDMDTPVLEGVKFEIPEDAPVPDPNAPPVNGNGKNGKRMALSRVSPRVESAMRRIGRRVMWDDLEGVQIEP